MSDRGMPLVDRPTAQKLVPQRICSSVQVHKPSTTARIPHSSISIRTARLFLRRFRSSSIRWARRSA